MCSNASNARLGDRHVAVPPTGLEHAREEDNFSHVSGNSSSRWRAGISIEDDGTAA
jgi:hypothetical protein